MFTIIIPYFDSNSSYRQRNLLTVIENYRRIMESVKESQVMQEQWIGYQKNFEYASDVEFDDACETVMQIMDELGWISI